MKKYNIIAESHEGAFSVEEECLDTIYANSEKEAMEIYSKKDKSIRYSDNWNCWLHNARQINAVEIN